jgi:hypothetical protein
MVIRPERGFHSSTGGSGHRCRVTEGAGGGTCTLRMQASEKEKMLEGLWPDVLMVSSCTDGGAFKLTSPHHVPAPIKPPQATVAEQSRPSSLSARSEKWLLVALPFLPPRLGFLLRPKSISTANTTLPPPHKVFRYMRNRG